ncbi:MULTISPECIES: hypothetical protein [Nocardia]|uniref:hypothetical protein n=1 Tax=Nocardia TaxID=1817 RepID=UPI0007EAE6A9|nr:MULTISPECIES: hypothetical protein [Nocardia]MBF6272372.1 hypothetical protein [Nocardia nova]OBA41501.1 hypothetical protein A5789_14385 [Nocardia sp. 852002-51101_SCH5132738]OBB40623.1 hypothetical protein A5748_32730 [Nocardia sp. 852002-51244_SCH5132740]OBF84076.1 hypothetical protein A9X06_15620 [Mycobacterium sp. 852002-51759_SCH5129042]
MKKFAVVAALIAGLAAPVGSAAAEPVTAPAAVTPIDAPTGSSSADVFCAVLKFLKGGWAGRPADCSF